MSILSFLDETCSPEDSQRASSPWTTTPVSGSANLLVHISDQPVCQPELLTFGVDAIPRERCEWELGPDEDAASPPPLFSSSTQALA